MISTIIFSQSDIPAEKDDPYSGECGYWTIFSNDQTIGVTGYSLREDPEGWKSSGWTMLKVKYGGKEKLLHLKYSAVLDSMFRLKTYKLRLEDSIQIECTWKQGTIKIVSGKAIKNESVETAHTGFQAKESVKLSEKPVSEKQSPNKQTTTTLSADTPPYIMDVNLFPHLAIMMKQIDLKSAEITYLPILIPQLHKSTQLQVAVGHKEKLFDKPAYKISFSGEGIFGSAWVDSTSSIIRRIEYPREELVLQFSQQCPDTSVIAAKDIEIKRPESKIKSEGVIENALRVEELKANIQIELSGDILTQRPWQKFKGEYKDNILKGKISITVDEYNGNKCIDFEGLKQLPEDLVSYVGPDENIPVEDDYVKGILERFCTEDVWKYVVQANRWVADNIKHKAGQSDGKVAGATRLGDPLARARLLTAILRNKGIPTKVVGGIYYFGAIWVPHYWIEVWLGKKVGWRPIDPSTGEDKNFSAVHITLFENQGEIITGEIAITKAK